MLIVIGNGGHSRVVVAALLSRGIKVDLITGTPAEDAEVEDMPGKPSIVIGIGNRATKAGPGMWARRALFERFVKLGFVLPPVVHIGASECGLLRKGVQIMDRAVINPGASIGENTLINTGAIVEHDCRVGRHCHIAPGAILCGEVTIGDGTHIGAGAVILQGCTVGPGCVVPAGETVRFRHYEVTHA